MPEDSSRAAPEAEQPSAAHTNPPSLRAGVRDILTHVDEAFATLESPWILPKQRQRRAGAELAILKRKLDQVLQTYCVEQRLQHLFVPDVFATIDSASLNPWQKEVLPLLQGLELRDSTPLQFRSLASRASPHVLGCVFRPYNVDVTGALAIGHDSPPSGTLIEDLQLALQTWVVVRRLFRQFLGSISGPASLPPPSSRHRALNELVAGLAHHMNTPMGVVIGASSSIESMVTRLSADGSIAREVTEDLEEACGLLDRNIRRTHRLIESFKLLSASQLAGRCEDLDLLELVSNGVSAFLATSEESLDIRIVDERQPTCRKWRGYSDHLVRALHNLLDNVACFAYPRGSRGRTDITVRSSLEDDRAAFSVSVTDFGAGISEADQERIFSPFFTTGSYQRHAGLGLTTVRTIVEEAFGGSVTCTSRRGVGTTFTLGFSHCSAAEGIPEDPGIFSVREFDGQRFVELQRQLASGAELGVDAQIELQSLKVAYDALLRSTFAPDGRRASIRVPVRRGVPAILADRMIAAELRDVSEDGAMLIVREEVQVKAKVTIICGDEPDLHLAGEIISVLPVLEPNSGQPLWRAGIRFGKHELAQLRALRIFMAQSILNLPER